MTLSQRQTLDAVFAQTEDLRALSPRDRGFVRAMVSASFREWGRFETSLAPFVATPFSDLSPLVRAFIIIGAVQLWRLQTPAHAAVGETVAAAKSEPTTRRASGLINAVLRRAASEPQPLDRIPASKIWPEWLWDQMRDDLGPQSAFNIAASQAIVPALNITAIDPKQTADELGGELLDSGSVRLDMCDVESLPGFEAGTWWVQDQAAALPARILAAKPGENIVDLCAAPGGKTLQLAAAGANVFAVDRSKHRLSRLLENLARTRFQDRVSVVTADARNWRPENKVDAVLLDAPCSALGTLARHPEGAKIKRASDIAGFPTLQRELVSAAYDMLKPGGRLIYCVCTPLNAEGKDVVAAARQYDGWQTHQISATEAGPFAVGLTANGDLLTVPSHEGGHDVFFISRLTKTASS